MAMALFSCTVRGFRLKVRAPSFSALNRQLTTTVLSPTAQYHSPPLSSYPTPPPKLPRPSYPAPPPFPNTHHPSSIPPAPSTPPDGPTLRAVSAELNPQPLLQDRDALACSSPIAPAPRSQVGQDVGILGWVLMMECCALVGAERRIEVGVFGFVWLGGVWSVMERANTWIGSFGVGLSWSPCGEVYAVELGEKISAL